MHFAATSPAIGSAHDSHFTLVIFGSALQQVAQQEAVRSRQGSSPPQTAHHDGRTIRAASRPKNDSAPERVVSTRDIVSGRKESQLNRSISSRIVPRMKKPAFFLAILVIAALPAAAQTSQNTSEFGILFGGTKLVNDVHGSQGQQGVNDFKFSNSAKSIYWAVQMEPGTWLRIKAEQMDVPILGLDANNDKTNLGKGKLEHVDALIDYKFSEPFGSTGIFAGIGMYRQNLSGAEDTNAGFSAGVNADFPFSRRYGLIVESAYHWVRLPARPRYITASGGLRISF
jgi:hypothetical protein